MEENECITNEKQSMTVPEVAVMDENNSDGMNGNGAKKRRRKRSQKQLERWMRYREKKYLEKVKNARKKQEGTVAVVDAQQNPATNEFPKVVVSNLRPEAEEFVPRSFTSTFSKQLSLPNDDSQNQVNDEIAANSVGNDACESVSERDDSICGVLSIYAASELHSSIDKVAYCTIKDAQHDFGYLYFSLSNL
ncbi:uncharacterized protein LOC132757843 [Ruditapes philippinarum]|uniref:uncharacterized protein LOC132757843 n=1 Tax=Ruditapes philippinarum TaxID=129788 RepID=UPI00295B736C|nr:uncharacterized protein LOC132757843 [Ruditapes philippinarum]